MTQFLIGLPLILLPFAAVLVFKDRLKGAIAVFSAAAVFHMAVALVLQCLHLFSYGNVLALHMAFAGACLAFAWKKRKASPTAFSWRPYWFVASAFVLIFLFLSSIHYRYSGVVDTGLGAESVTESSYPYPMYSDEWVAVSLADYSIRTGMLPLANPLDHDAPFINFLAGFHSLIAEVFLLLGLSPLAHYAWLAILNGLLTCAAAYLILRLSGAGTGVSAAAAMSLPLITNAGNLPGLWYLLPYNLSLTFLLLSILGFLAKSRLAMFAGAALALAAYPPMIVFVAPAIAGMFLSEKKVRWGAVAAMAAAAAAIFLLGAGRFGLSALAQKAFSLLIGTSEDGGRISYGVWNIVPLFLLPFIPWGLLILLRKKACALLMPAAVGSLAWIMYAFIEHYAIIGYPRVVSVTSALLVIAAGFGMDAAYRHLKRKHPQALDASAETALRCIVLAFFVLMYLASSRMALWNKLTLEVKEPGVTRTLIPSPPVTRYLEEDDLRLFEGVKGKTFIAPMWKGLAIAVATGNYPLYSKGSTISVSTLSYEDFVREDCAGKERLARQFRIDYAYAAPLDCSFFVPKGTSGQGLTQYEFIKGVI